jgi:hypothetical protein
MKRKEKELCSSDSLLFRMNAFGTRLFVNSSFVLLVAGTYRQVSIDSCFMFSIPISGL